MGSKQGIPRRQCMQYLGLLGLGAATSGMFFKPVLAQTSAELHRASSTLPLMGTLVSIILYDNSRQKAVQVLEEALLEMQNLIPIFSRFDPQGHLGWLNQHKILKEVPPELDLVLQQAFALHQASAHNFDVSVLPFLQAYQKSAAKSGRSPDPARIKELHKALGMDKIELKSGKIKLLHPEAGITLDGIAKGYIVDRAARLIQNRGISHALIDAGGDLRVIGGKDQDSPWRIGITDPKGRKQYVQTIALRDMAVATSGHYQNFFDPGRRHHHLLQPGQNASPANTASCTVVAPSAMLADGLSTALFVLPVQQGLDLIQKYQPAQAHIIHKGGRSFSSPGWRGRPA